MKVDEHGNNLESIGGELHITAGGKRLKGFAVMPKDQQRAIASKGGKTAHARGTAHEFNAEEARQAGRRGGQAVSRDREHMSRIGKKGGHNRGKSGR